MNAYCAAACASVAAWCSLGTLGLHTASATRVGLLPPWWLLPVLMAGAVAVAHLIRLTSSEATPLYGSALLVLPWLPLPVPPALLLWTGAVETAVWLAVGVSVVTAMRPRWAGLASWLGRWLAHPTWGLRLAIGAALTVYLVSSWWLSPALPGGDEPHYLVITQSLLHDGDLRIEDNHQRGEYSAYYPGPLRPDFLQRGVDGQIYSIHAPGLSALVAPAFAVGGYPGVLVFLAIVSALGAGLLWRLGLQITGSASAAWFGWAAGALTVPFVFLATQVFPDGLAAPVLLVGLWPLLRPAGEPRLDEGPGERSDSTLAARGGSPASHRMQRAFHHGLLGAGPDPGADEGSPEPFPAGLTGLWRWGLAGLALSLLPWLHTRFAILAAAAAVCLLFRVHRVRQAAALLAFPVVSALAWFGYFLAIYGTVDPSAPYGHYTQTAIGNLVMGLPGLFVDQQFGLFANAPVYAGVLVGLAVALVRGARWPWVAVLLAVPYITAVGMFHMWWGGASVPARFLSPLALVAGVAAARVWAATTRPALRTALGGLLGGSLLLPLVLAGPGHGALLFNVRDGFALWLEWANEVIDLPRALPSLFRDAPAEAWLKAGVWTASAALGLGLYIGTRAKLQGAATWGAALALSVGVTAVWRVDGVQPLTPNTAAVALLRGASSGLLKHAVDYDTGRVGTPGNLLADLRLRRSERRPVPEGGPLLGFPYLAAGRHRVRVELAGESAEGSGTLTLRIGRFSPPLQHWTLPRSGSEAPNVPLDESTPDRRFITFDLWLPVDVRALYLEEDEVARRSVVSAVIEPWADARVRRALGGGVARQAARYGTKEVYFLDDRAYAEAPGFWVAGDARSRVVLSDVDGGSAPDGIGTVPLHLFVRNAPVDNTLVVRVGEVRYEVTLAPGEERMLFLDRPGTGRDVPVQFETTGGFIPAEVEAGSTDRRYLGVWVEPR